MPYALDPHHRLSRLDQARRPGYAVPPEVPATPPVAGCLTAPTVPTTASRTVWAVPAGWLPGPPPRSCRRPPASPGPPRIPCAAARRGGGGDAWPAGRGAGGHAIHRGPRH